MYSRVSLVRDWSDGLGWLLVLHWLGELDDGSGPSETEKGLSFMWWWGFDTPRVRWIMRWRKGLPGGTTLQAKFKVPIRNCSSWSVADFLFWKESRAAWIRYTLSSGNLASIVLVSRIITMNWMTWKGPSVLGRETGTFKFLKVRSILDKLALQIQGDWQYN